MAQVNDLLVLGKSNFLGEVNTSSLLSAKGGIALSNTTAENTALQYVLGIKAFAEGGNVMWSSISNFANQVRLNASGNWAINISGTAAKATADASGNTITSTYLKLSGGTMTGPITMNVGTGLQMKYESGKDTVWMYPNGANTYGIRYLEGTPDKMMISASGNNSTAAGADLCINGNGDGTVTIRGNTILHAGNFTSYTVTKTGSGASGTWGISITGNAGSSTYASNIRITSTNPTTATTYNIPFVSGVAANTNYSLLGNESLRYKTLEGTESAEGYGRLYLGNSKGTGTAGNKSGGILIYSSGTSYQLLLAHSNAANGDTAASSRTTYLRDYGATAYLVATTTRNAVGSAALPVYVNTSGKVTACTAGSVFSVFSSSTNTLSITVAGQTRTASAVNSVSNTWAGGTTSGPTITTTVNGVVGAAKTIPSASTGASGVVTTGAQRFRGAKTLEYPVISSNNSRYQGFYYKNGADTTVGEHWYDTGDATNITTGKFYWRQYSPNSTANSTTSGYYENFYLPTVTVGRTANASYEIFTSKSYTTLDSRYVNVSGDTMTGGLILKNGTYYGSLSFQPSMGSSIMGYIYLFSSTSSGTTYTKNQFYFREYSYTASSTTRLSYYEDYALPSVTTERTTNATYNILTTKNTITTAQGGTGLKSFTANRMLYTSSTSAIGQAHFVNASKIGINYTSEPSYNFYVNGTSAMTNVLTFISATATNQKITTSSGAMYYASASTTYLDSGSGSSIIFRPQGTEKARFDTSGQFLIKTTTYAYAMLPATTNTYALGNSSYCWGTAYLGTTYTYHVYPRATNTYNLGSSSAGWANSYMNNLYIRDNANNYTGGRFYTTASTSTTSQASYLTIGNSTATGTAGSRYGVLRIYSTGADYAQLQYNDVGSYGRLRLTNAKGSYYGILLGAATSGMSIMSQDASHQGLYQQSNSKWIVYHNGAGSICIGGSTVATNYPIVLNGATKQIGTFWSTGDIWGNHVYPNATATYNLGSTTYKWNNVYTNTLTASYLAASTIQKMPIYWRHGGSRYGEIVVQNNAGTTVGGIISDVGNATTIQQHRWRFRSYSANATNDAATTGYYEDYYLPASTDGITASTSYNILTTKKSTDTYTVGRLIATATADAAAASANNVALITGDPAGAHLEFDGNEIIAKSNGTTGTILYLNSGGTYTQLYKVVVSTGTYGSSLPTAVATGQIFFKLV